ncbi:MAG: hypothetical protein ABFS09_06170 [Thermodesulfobacteriota bacterium]
MHHSYLFEVEAMMVGENTAPNTTPSPFSQAALQHPAKFRAQDQNSNRPRLKNNGRWNGLKMPKQRKLKLKRMSEKLRVNSRRWPASELLWLFSLLSFLS